MGHSATKDPRQVSGLHPDLISSHCWEDEYLSLNGLQGIHRPDQHVDAKPSLPRRISAIWVSGPKATWSPFHDMLGEVGSAGDSTTSGLLSGLWAWANDTQTKHRVPFCLPQGLESHSNLAPRVSKHFPHRMGSLQKGEGTPWQAGFTLTLRKSKEVYPEMTQG